MLAMRRPLLTVLAVATAALALTSCSDDDGVACVDGVVELGTGLDLELGDDCALVRISGTDTTVDVTGVDVEQVEINGDRNHVVADAVPEAVRISGQENTIEGVQLGTVEIHGDRNVVSVEDDVTAVAVHGNDNEVGAETVGDVTDGGDRNTFAESS
ncbi:DUF3060 domain-containing protein [Isoptericola jiangsuensis]|uniref:DUF3060 domain-containing protein n=1 Tax=Isoptericola jiangsuensis TaxID=548579 RepID=UPI003AAD8644